MTDYWTGIEMIPPEEVKLGGVTSDMARKWKLLQELQVRLPLGTPTQLPSFLTHLCHAHWTCIASVRLND